MTTPLTLGEVAAARERFLGTGEAPAGVRPAIVRSWQRSVASGVDPEHPELPFVRDVDGDTALSDAATPVARRLLEEIAGSGTAMLLSDRGGTVIRRWVEDPALASHLERQSGGPGFAYTEALAGTNAVGTSLEDCAPTLVRGPEFFASCFRPLSAVAAPIPHPATGRVEGVIGLVCKLEDGSPLMLPLAQRAAQEVAARLVSGYAAADRALLDSFLRVERRGPRRPTLAVNERVLVTNRQAADLLASGDQPLVWDRARRALRDGASTFSITTGEGTELELKLIEARDGPARVGTLLQVGPSREEAPAAVRRHAHAGRRPSEPPARLREWLPGPSPLWQDVLRKGWKAAAARDALLLVGEPGAGKRAMAEALCALAATGGTTVEHDAQEAVLDPAGWLRRTRATLADGDGSVVLTHLEQLSPPALRMLCQLVERRAGGRRRLVVATYRPTTGAQPPPELLARFAHVLEVPALRQRPEDIPAIVDAVLGRMPGAARVDAAARRALVERDWPGNVAQLRTVVETARAAAAGRLIRLVDLPGHTRASSPARPLSRLERVEREAIVAGLAAAGGNKQLAAANLGISRSTLYRRLSVLGIEA